MENFNIRIAPDKLSLENRLSDRIELLVAIDGALNLDQALDIFVDMLRALLRYRIDSVTRSS